MLGRQAGRPAKPCPKAIRRGKERGGNVYLCVVPSMYPPALFHGCPSSFSAAPGWAELTPPWKRRGCGGTRAVGGSGRNVGLSLKRATHTHTHTYTRTHGEEVRRTKERGRERRGGRQEERARKAAEESEVETVGRERHSGRRRRSSRSKARHRTKTSSHARRRGASICRYVVYLSASALASRAGATLRSRGRIGRTGQKSFAVSPIMLVVVVVGRGE